MNRSFPIRLAFVLVEVLIVGATWVAVDSPPAAVATPASPVIVGSTPGPTGLTLDSPWIYDSTGNTAWTYGVTSNGYGNLVTYATATGVFSTSQYTNGEVSAVGAGYSPTTNVGAFTVARSGFGNRLVIANLATGAKIASRQMASDETAIRAVAFDSTGSFVWLATNTNPLRIYKISATTGNQTSSLLLSTPFKDATSAVVSGNTLFLTLNTSPVRILPVDMTTVTNSSSTSLPAGTPALVDPVLAGGIAFYGSDGTPGRVTAIDLASRTIVGSIDLGAGETGAHGLSIDSGNGRLYVTTSTASGPRVVSIDTTSWARLGQVDLGAGSEARATIVRGHRLTVGFGGTRGATTLSIAPAPSAPPSLAVRESDRMLEVTWGASSSLETVTAYTVTATGDGTSTRCTTPALSCSLTGLRNGVDYVVSVTASSIAGDSAASQSNGNPYTSPSAPQSVIATRRDRGLDVRWQAADTGGRSLIEFMATARPGGATCTTRDTACTITGLTNGVSYSVSVTARTIAGLSPDSVSSAPVIPATRPTAAREVLGMRGNREIVASWTAPTDDGGRPVTDYIVTTDPSSAGCTTRETTCTITGLTNGTSYRLTVVARNEVGESPSAIAAASVTPATRPDEPRNPVGERGNREITVRWAAPIDDGGQPITDYIVTTDPSSAGCTTRETTCTITGLTNGTSYRLHVVARNEVGESPSAIAAASVTPATRPTEPRNPVGERGNREITVRWAAPIDDGGQPVTDYIVTTDPSSAGCTTGETFCTIAGLTNGVAYRLTVVARNDVGASPAVSALPVTPATTPSDVRNASVLRGNRSAHLDWLVPSSDGGSPIVGYRVFDSTTGELVCGVETPWCTIDGLSNGRTYSFDVIAVNDVGSSSSVRSGPVVPATVPAQPQTPRITSFDGWGMAEWDAVVDDGGDAIIDYLVRVMTSDATIREFSTTSTTAIVDGLTNGEHYLVFVLARNSLGESTSSTAGVISPVEPVVIVDPTVVDPPVVDPPVVDPPVVDPPIVDPPIVDPPIVDPPVVDPPVVDPPVVDPPVVDPPVVDPPVVDPPWYPQATTPDVPTGIVLVRKYRSSLVVAWVPPADGGSPIRDYLIEKASRPDRRFVHIPDGVSASPVSEIPRPKRGALYLRIIAVNAVGLSGPSSPTRIVPR